MMNGFEQLLQELGIRLGLSLKPDSNQSCLLDVNGISLQIDLDSEGEEIILGSFLGKLLPGPYRARIFAQALKKNATAKMGQGTLAFTRKSDSLVLFQFLPLSHLNGEKFYNFSLLFLEHARIWIEGLKRGEIPRIEETK